MVAAVGRDPGCAYAPKADPGKEWFLVNWPVTCSAANSRYRLRKNLRLPLADALNGIAVFILVIVTGDRIDRKGIVRIFYAYPNAPSRSEAAISVQNWIITS